MSGWKPIAVYSVFFARRFLFTVLLDESLKAVQFISISFLSLGVMVYYLGVRPYVERNDFVLEAANECVFLYMTYFVLMFSDWVSGHSARSTMGWVFNGLVGLQIFVNFGWVVIKLIKSQINQCKLKKMRREYQETQKKEQLGI